MGFSPDRSCHQKELSGLELADSFVFCLATVSPLVWTPDQLVGAPIGSDVTLECNMESHPHSVTYWTRNNGQQIIVSNAKYDSIMVEGSTSVYKSEMRLKIKDLRPSDLGSYTCVAKNSLGEASGTIKVYEIPKLSTQTSDVLSYTSASKEHSNRRNKYYIGTKSSVAFEDNPSGNGLSVYSPIPMSRENHCNLLSM